MLVAEDSKINQRVTLGMLGRLGYAADVVENGLDALAALEHSPYAAVLMDCQMPVMDGIEATAEIRRRERSEADQGQTVHVPIIALTANALESDRQRCLMAGMDDFLAKPLRSDLLAALLKQWAGEPGPVEPSTVDALDGARTAPTTRVRYADAAMPPSSAIDPAAVQRMRALQPDIVAELVEIFLEQAPEQVETLRTAARTGAFDLIRRAAHTLKGDAAAWGASALEQRCAEIEQILPEDLASTFDEHLAALERELDRVSAALRELSRMERHLV